MIKRVFTPMLFIFFVANHSFAQRPSGEALLTNGLKAFKPFGAGVSNAIVQEVAVTGQPFTTAFSINTFNRPGNGDYGLSANITSALHKGDVLWISFKAHCLESKKESGEAFLEIRVDQLVDGKYKWPSYLERGVSIGKEWTETSIPFTLTSDVAPENVRFVIKFDSYAQRLELGPINFINYGQNVKMADLPRSVVHYDGDAPDASWRKAAEERIEKYRKADLEVKIVDQNGKPVQGATISVQMKKIAFAWGTATNSKLLLDSTDPMDQMYRDTLTRYFNKVVFENEMKAKNWDKFNASQTKAGVSWLKARNITLRGHVMVWPSWQNSPQLVKYKNDTAALRAAILKQIDEQTTVMKGQFAEWDVVNEPYANHNIMDSLGGKAVMIDWFKAAKKNTKDVKLFLNEYTMFHNRNESEQFYNTVKFLKDNGAPIEAIGEQSHIGGTPPGIDYIINTLDHFAEFGLPIQISEFDITSDDDDFKARYIKDFMTALFSHPSVIGMLQWGFWANSHWIPAAALWDKDWNIRPEGRAFTNLVSKTWVTNVTGATDREGIYKTRVFNGDYEIFVKKGNSETLQKLVIDRDGKNIVIKL